MMKILKCVLFMFLILPVSQSSIISNDKEQRNRYLEMMEHLIANAEKTKQIASKHRVPISDTDQFNQMIDMDGNVFWGNINGRQIPERPGICRTSLGTLVCCPGFKESIEGTSLKCQPYCPLGCRDGLCIEPGLCQCPVDKIFVKEEGRCVMKCPQSCLNGKCVAQVLCHCLSGYLLHSSGEYCLPPTTNFNLKN